VVMLLKEVMEKDLEMYEKTGRYISQEKIDGDRVKAIVGRVLGKRSVILINRHENNYSFNFPELINGLGIRKDALGDGKVVLDGEVAHFDKEKGVFDHNKITARQHTIKHRKIMRLRLNYPAKFYIFDLIEMNGINMVNNPLYPFERRYELLKQIIINNNVTELLPIRNDLVTFFKEECLADREGIVIKALSNIYCEGRSDTILKIKNWKYDVIKFEDYEECKTGGIVLTNDRDRVLCPSRKDAELIKTIIEQSGYTYEKIRHLQKRNSNGKLREGTYAGHIGVENGFK